MAGPGCGTAGAVTERARLFSPDGGLYHPGMRIACPSCNAVYQVPDEQLAEGQIVRCVRCATDWSPVVAVPAGDARIGRAEAATPEVLPMPPSTPEPLVPEPLVVEPLTPEPLAPVRQMALDEDAVTTVTAVRPAAVPAARRGMPWLALAWVVSVLAVVGGVVALVAWRETVMQVWPPSIRAYVALGASRP